MKKIERLIDSPNTDDALKALLSSEIADASGRSLASLGAKIAAAIAVNAMPSVGLMATTASSLVLVAVVGVTAGIIGFGAGRVTAPTIAVSEMERIKPPVAIAQKVAHPMRTEAIASVEVDTGERALAAPQVKAPVEVEPKPLTVSRSKRIARVRLPSKPEVSTGMQGELHLFERGEAALSEGRHAAAIEALTLYLQKYPNGRLAPEARLGALRSYMSLGDVDAVHKALPGLWADQALLPQQRLTWTKRVSLFLVANGRCDLVKSVTANAADRPALSNAWREVLEQNCEDDSK